MNFGLIIPLIIGVLIIYLGCWVIKNRHHEIDEIKEWETEPRAIVKITGTKDIHSRDGDYRGYRYSGEILINGTWYNAESKNTFTGKRTCEYDEEITVAYRPIKESKSTEFLDTIMDAMTTTLFDESWEDRKPRYQFKFMEPERYVNEKGSVGTSIFLICFGSCIAIMSILGFFGIIS